jgi:hypothetical protein
MRVSIGLLVALAACGKSPGGGDTIDAPGTGSDSTTVGIDAPPPPDGFTALIGRSWSLKAGETDTYRCTRLTTTEDIYIAAYHADAPQGTHHTVLSISQSTQPDGDYDCSAGSLDYQMLFASGVGTDDLAFPSDVGFMIPKGSKVNLNLHLFDATDHALTGTTTIYIKKLAAAPAQLAEMVFAGTILNINVPKDDQVHTATGGCTLTADATVAALWPHMHQTATHQLVQLTPKGTSTAMAVLDDAYSFAEQKNYPQSPTIAMHTGDKLQTTCTYVNHSSDPNTGDPERFGESSNDEMCFTGIYRYPAQGQGIFGCVDNGMIPNP